MYKVTYNNPANKYYQTIDTVCADSKWHAIELIFSRNNIEYPERKFYKAKLLK